MYPRILTLPSRSFFLFGPRATGKTTWLGLNLSQAKVFDLLKSDLRLLLLKDPSELRRRVEAEPPGTWIVIDEVQQVPMLLNEVHALMRSGRYRFALCGSSARKLRRGQANLLAGRAVIRNLFPLTTREVNDASRLQDLIAYGCLPMVVLEPKAREEILEAYTHVYLREEIQAEALVRDLAAFSRFLECAALANAQVTNFSSLGRDAGIQRPTVRGYFQILEDTLVGYLLPAWRLRARIKEVAHPKFYWFDPGVARAMAGRARDPVERAEWGALLETFVLHELRAYSEYEALRGKLGYWRTASGLEVDFVWSRRNRHVAIEVKAARTWRSELNRGLRALGETVRCERQIGVYLGETRLRYDRIEVLPLNEFLGELYAGRVLT